VNENPGGAAVSAAPPTLTAALSLAGLGWHVFPAKRDKTPRTLRGFHAATTDEEQIRQWWNMWPDADLAVRTGKESGIVVIDADGDEGEQTSIDRGLFDLRTPTVFTAKGVHWYFEHPGYPVQSKVRILPGLDVRADGGYVVVPPSVHVTGYQYAWHDWTYPTDTPLHPMPAWVVQRRDPIAPVEASAGVQSPRYVEAAFRQELDAVRSAPEGERNDTLNKAAFAIARFVPVLPARRMAEEFVRAAVAAGLTESEARRTLASALEARSR
jgi:hypothetical protein